MAAPRAEIFEAMPRGDVTRASGTTTLMPSKRSFLVVLLVWVLALFVAGAVWRAFHPEKARGPSQARQLASRQDGYYLCLHRARMSDAEMRALIARRLGNDYAPSALIGCQEAQGR